MAEEKTGVLKKEDEEKFVAYAAAWAVGTPLTVTYTTAKSRLPPPSLTVRVTV